MANRFTQQFTLKDIFNNKKLKNKLPLINYKEKEVEDGKISATTNAKTVNRLVFDTSVSAARPFYNPLKPTRSGDVMIIGGNLVGDHNSAVESIYNALIAKRTIILWTANNSDMIRSALKESEKNKRKFGLNSKLYLRAQSMQEIEGMSRPQIQAFLSDIMENIVNGDDFPKTQKKYNVEEISVKSPYNYEQRKLIWKQKVGNL